MEASIYHSCQQELVRYEAEQPGLARVISLGKAILEIQESVREELGPTPPPSPEGLSNLRAGEPALSGQTVSVPTGIFRRSAEKLAAVFTEVAGEKFPLDRLLALPQLQGEDASALAGDVMADRLNLEPIAEGSGFNVETVSYFMHSLLVPFFESEAEPYAPVIGSQEIRWAKGICPVCGALPRYGVYHGEKGYRKLYCGLCRAEWPYPRLKCPFCENPERAGFRLLKLGADEAHMAEVCDSCQMYVKTTDERPLLRECLPAVEDIVTAAIDLAAVKEGLSRPA